MSARRRRCRVMAPAACLAACAAAAGGHARAGEAAINAEALAPFLRAASSGRVDVVGFGDSNQLLGAHGWDHGWSRALALRFGMYATGLVSPGENAGLGGGMGYKYAGFAVGASGSFAVTGAPSFHDARLSAGVGMGPLNYLHVGAGAASATGFNLGMFIEADCPVNVDANLRFHYVFGRFAGASGLFRPMVRLQEPPYSTLVTAAPVSSGAPADDVIAGFLDVGAAPRGKALNFRICPWGEPIDGPFIWYYSRAENLDRARGASFSTLYGIGGQSSHDMALALQTADDSYLALFFSRLRASQGSPKRVLIHVNSGLRDLREEEASVGPNPQLPGSSPGAFADNVQGIINRLTGVWALNSWDAEELFFLVTVSHPIANPDDPLLLGYRDAAALLATTNPRTASVRLDALTSYQEILSNGWYNFGGTDVYHLTAPGFEELSRRELHALRPIECWADLDADGAVDFVDLNTLLSKFGAPNAGPNPPTIAAGDVDADGDVDFADLNALLGAFGQPCASNPP